MGSDDEQETQSGPEMQETTGLDGGGVTGRRKRLSKVSVMAGRSGCLPASREDNALCRYLAVVGWAGGRRGKRANPGGPRRCR
jgi:hypothetical protein